MRHKFHLKIQNITEFKQQLFEYFSMCKHFIFLDSNNYKNDVYSNYEFIAARGAHKYINPESERFETLKREIEKHKDWLFGLLSYELKNETEDLYSKNADNLKLPKLIFFIPKMVFYFKNNLLTVEYLDLYADEENIKTKIDEIQKINVYDVGLSDQKTKINHRVNKVEYLESVGILKKHIKRGDIYEINYCTEFYSENIEVNPHELFKQLNKISPVPFGAFARIKDYYLISASPERFLKKSEKKIISQPIKGTAKRGKSTEEDKLNANSLRNDIKEQAENVMIVDLVRNDLSRTAAKGSVQVEELFGIYKFPQVFQMISTISSKIHSDKHPVDVIKAAFPPGSMTGAPKISAMQLTEKYEKTQRGWYAGSIGYFSPEQDFDFNVIIRSILYNAKEKYLSFTVGGAITDKSVPEKEYDECLLKAEAIFGVLGIY